MQSKPAIVVFVFIALLLALIAGFGAGRLYEDRAPAQQARAPGNLPPLPDWVGEPLPDFSKYTDTQARKNAFFSYLFPRIALANQRVLTLRGQVKSLSAKPSLTADDKDFLAAQAERLRVDAPVGSPELFELLDRRLDIIPPSLVLAQAANESGWGRSRFATQGNNLFGEWCFSKGCGLVPLNRADDAGHEVASFESPYQSVRSYVTNLNRHPSYQELRDNRAQLRARQRMPTGAALAQGLGAYSERGDAYIDEILGMMSFNELQRYDRLFDAWREAGAEPEPALMLGAEQTTSMAH